jgi:NTP pyrophosphatase (non-canonical NTP hydrolase)
MPVSPTPEDKSMNLAELQAELRHFAAERDWQPFHTPKNLSTALLVEAAELAEIFQWMTPEQSQAVSLDADHKARVAGEIADVLLYLLQLADHCEVDIAQAATHKLAHNARKYPPLRAIPRVSQENAAVSGVHVLLDYENVQPSGDELRALVPEASQVWVFHGPHQRHVEKHFAGLGAAVTAVPISKTGKNALDFHLSFYMGYIASRNPSATLVVVANDKGYEPMLEHARAMGFAARQLGHVKAKLTAPAAKTRAKRVATPVKKAATISAAAAAAAAAAAEPASAPTPAPAKKAPAKKAATKKATAAPAAPKAAAKKSAPAEKVAPAARKTRTPRTAAPVKRLIDNLRRMGEQRPTKTKSLWRLLKSLLGSEATDDAVEAVLGRLVSEGVVKVSSVTGVSYPQFADR